MTRISFPLAASTGWRVSTVSWLYLVISLALFQGCSLAPEDALATTESPRNVESTSTSVITDVEREDKTRKDDTPDEGGNRADEITYADKITYAENDAPAQTNDQRSNESKSGNGLSAEANKTKKEANKNGVPKKTFELTFDDLAFEMKKTESFKRSMLTPKINGYDGGTVRLRGYIRPSFSQTGLTKFVFVRDNKECCFGPGAALYDCVLVRLAKGKKTEYTVRPVTIEGKFYLKEYKGPDGKVWSIYRMKDGRVR